MSWSKLKTIIILILLLLNLFLLVLVGSNRLRTARYDAAALSGAASVLELNGIQVDRGSLPAAMELSPVIAARDTRREAALAAALLGSDVRTDDPAGGLYVYHSSSGSATFRSNGEFIATFSDPVPVPGGSDRAAQARSLLSGLELWQVSESGDTLTAVQQLDGAPVFPTASSTGQPTAGILFLYDEQDRLTQISGRLCLGDITADPEAQEPITVPTALIAFFNFIVDSGDVCQRIDRVQPVYRTVAMTDPVRLSPAWRITTDTGEYFLDAATGEVTRAAHE